MKLIYLRKCFVRRGSFGIHFRNLFLSAPSFNSEYMSRNLLQWLRRTRMHEGMIWGTYFKHRRKELRERFPQIGRVGTSKTIMTYLLIRKLMDDGLNFYILSEKDGRYHPIQDKDLFGHFYVEIILFVFPNNQVDRYTIDCYCSRRLCRNPYIEIPAFHFRISFKQWPEMDVVDFIEHVPEFFTKWNQEMWTIEHEITKIQKKKEMKKLREKLMGMRCLESYIQLRYQGLCEMKEDRITVIVPLNNGHDLTVRTPFLYYIPNWWERIEEMVNAFNEYFTEQIDKGLINLGPFSKEFICYSNNQWYDSSFRRVHKEDLEALSKKKGWRKWCPITVEIA